MRWPSRCPCPVADTSSRAIAARGRPRAISVSSIPTAPIRPERTKPTPSCGCGCHAPCSAPMSASRDVYAGRMIPSGPHSALFASYLQTYAGLVGRMSDAEAKVAIEGALHLVRTFTATSEGPVSSEALRSLALVHIERGLHDPQFSGRTRCAGACRCPAPGSTPRSRTAKASWRRSVTRGSTVRAPTCPTRRRARESVATIMIRCGFTDPSLFSRSFRRRFGMAPRDVRPR